MLCDVELRQHFQAAEHSGGAVARDALELAKHPVDAQTDEETVGLRQQVDVAGALLGRLEDQRVDELDERPRGLVSVLSTSSSNENARFLEHERRRVDSS